MTKKDYVVIAGIIRRNGISVNEMKDVHAKAFSLHLIKSITDDLAIMFADDNPNFNAGKFMEACGFAV